MAGESDASPAGQKRPRDYGEELKGLTPERHSDREGSISPTRKKLRTDDSPSPEILDPSADGEVNGLVAHPDTVPSEIAAESGSAPEPAAVPDSVPNDEPSKEDDQETSASQGPSGITRGVRLLGVRTSFGKPKGASATPPTQTPIIKPTAPSVPPTEDRAKNGSDNEYSEGEVEEDDEGGDDEDGEVDEDMRPTTSGASSDYQPTDTNNDNDTNGFLTFRVTKKEWKLPRGEIRTIKHRNDVQDKLSWWNDWIETELDFLIALLMRENPDNSVNKKVVQGALADILHHRSGYLVGASRSQNKVFKNEAKRAIRICNPDVWDAATAKAQWRVSNNDFSAPGETQSPVSKTAEAPSAVVLAPGTSVQGNGGSGRGATAMSEDEEVRQLELYFPRVGDVQVVCLHCVSTQHRSENCPSLRCGFCQSDAHMSYSCPTKKRCTKCYQLGHGVESCQEKLALAKDERPGCAYCSARGHLEKHCPTVWRSYQPGLTELKKVKEIPCYCYMCGAAGHYGPECGLLSKKKSDPQVWTTWSKANRDSYVDPESANIAIAQVGVDHSDVNGVSEFHIKGKATKKTHIHFISSDESESEFIKPPVSRGGPRGPKGGISISTNIVQPSQQSGGRPRRNRNGQPPPPGTDMPPLPPGPPPPMVFNGNGNGNGNGPQRSFHPLPPRPGMISNGGGGGGRGGGNRGRGRGGRGGNRGRGR